MKYTRLAASEDSLASGDTGSGISTPSRGSIPNATVDLDDINGCEELSMVLQLQKVDLDVSNTCSENADSVSNESKDCDSKSNDESELKTESDTTILDNDIDSKLSDTECENDDTTEEGDTDAVLESTDKSVTGEYVNEACSLNTSEEDSNDSKDNSETALLDRVQEVIEKLESDKVTKQAKGFKADEIERFKLVVTYVFDFDMDAETVENELYVSDDGIENEDDDEEEDNFICDLEENGLNREASIRNGSKNNLLDSSFESSGSDSMFEDQLDEALESDEMAETCYHTDESEDEVKDDTKDNKDDNESGNVSESENEGDGLEHEASSACLKGKMVADKVVNVSQSSVNKSMRKGYIYYSSEAKLYQGDLYYSHCDLSSKVEMRKGGKYKMVRKLFRRVFPTQKYTLN